MVQMRYLRESVGKTWRNRIRNAQIRKDLRQKLGTNIIERKGLRWFGFVDRYSEGRKPNQILKVRAERKRERVRPRIKWLQRTNMGRKGKTLQEIKRTYYPNALRFQRQIYRLITLNFTIQVYGVYFIHSTNNRQI